MVVFTPVFSFSQTVMEKVLVEMGTATWSSSCAAEVQIINEMKQNGLEICVVNYHLNDPYANQHANQRAAYYGIQNLPFPVVGGQEVEIGNYNSYLEQYNLSINYSSSFSISSEAHFSEDTLLMDISIEKLADYESNLISLYATVTESDIPVNWHGLTEVDEVERSMAPDGSGNPLDFSNDNILTIHQKILFDRNWNPENMELVIFIQDDNNKMILQCHSQPIIDFAPLPVHAFFSVADTMTCMQEYVQFQNFSTGDVENVLWTFEEGIPGESTLVNPAIKYNEEGAFKVTLVVSNSVSTDTLSIDEFIHVQVLPQMSFNPLPEFCHNLETYELYQGSPQGGNYFGLFVDTGYFHPQAAGLGIHPVYYAFQDETTGCSDTLSQDALVHICPFIPEEEKEDEIPFFMYSSDHKLELMFKKNQNIQIEQIVIFNLNGQKLAQRSYLNQEAANYQFLIPSANSFVFILVHSSGRDYLLKHQMQK